MQIFVNEDGTFYFLFTRKETGLGKSILQNLNPSSPESEQAISTSIQTLTDLEHEPRYDSNVLPFPSQTRH